MSNHLAFVAEPLEGRTLFAVILVDDDKQQFANAPYNTLAAAVKAAKAGDTIRVAPGTYRQSVTIPAGKDNLTIISAVTRKAIIDPPDGSQQAFYVKAKNVSIRRFTINGLNTSYGVLLNGDVSATIADCRIKSVRNEPLDGVQLGYGIGIFQGTATITNNVIDDYQKGGIFVDGGHSKATITGNTLVGAGTTTVIAQNGIIFNRNASGTISDNTISRNTFNGGSTSTGISLYRARDMLISGNTLSDNDENINVDFSTTTRILDNEASGGRFDGLALFRTTGAIVRSNHFHDNTLDGIFVDARCSGNTIQMNTLDGNVEFDANDASTGSGTGGTADTWSGNTIGTKSPSGLA